ncbi:MAG TPA: hypothetical protein VL094_07280 [Sphingomonadaceae bacterium]|nr:hypothetical protein [Sphingomonadaceae bacterium]
MKNIHRSLVIGCSLLALSACGPDDIASPGGGNITINYPAPTPAPTAPTPTPTGGLSTAAANCPTIADPQGLTDGGVLSGPSGTWRACTLPRTLAVSSTLPRVPGVLYQLAGRVDVGCDGGFAAPSAGSPHASTTVGCGTLTGDTNVELTIDPGVIVFGGTGVSWLAVNRGNKINAVGTAAQPIIFTSRQNIVGLTTEASSGQWGGVVLMGRATITDCKSGGTPGVDCERDTEGASDPATFGGLDDTYNAGHMDYVQIRYSGYVIGIDKELQSLTPEGVGSGTKLGHIMSYNSSDDGIEFFGGVVNLKHYVAVGAEDDSLDIDTGARVKIQHAIIAQRTGVGDTMMEIDSNKNESNSPRTNVKLSNFTFFQGKTGNDDLASLFVRGNADVSLMNGVLVSPDNPCFGMFADQGSAVGDRATAAFKSVVMKCSSPFVQEDSYKKDGVPNNAFANDTAKTAFGDGSNNNNASFTPAVTRTLFVNGTAENGVQWSDPADAFFDTVSYIGAVKDTVWYSGWVCNSAAATFGNSVTGNCTDIPVY